MTAAAATGWHGGGDLKLAGLQQVEARADRALVNELVAREDDLICHVEEHRRLEAARDLREQRRERDDVLVHAEQHVGAEVVRHLGEHVGRVEPSRCDGLRREGRSRSKG